MIRRPPRSTLFPYRSEERRVGKECRSRWSIIRSEEHTSELQSHSHLVCRLLLGNLCVTRPRGFGDAGRRPVRHRCFFFNDTATTEIYSLSLPDALPISVVYH